MRGFTTKMLHGGRVLGSGSYGCVIDPPGTYCDYSDYNPGGRTVAKMFLTREDLLKERYGELLFYALDPTGYFHVPGIGRYQQATDYSMLLPVCVEKKIPYSDFRGCEEFFRGTTAYDARTSELVVPVYSMNLHGVEGATLDRVVQAGPYFFQSEDEAKNFCRRLVSNLLFGLSLMENRVVHFDLHFKNIMCEEATQRILMFDYGFTQRPAELISEIERNGFRSRLQFWQTPLEAYLLQNFNEFYERPIEVVTRMHAELFSSRWIDDNPYTKFMGDLDLTLPTLIQIYTRWLEIGKIAAESITTGVSLKSRTNHVLLELFVVGQDTFNVCMNFCRFLDDSWFTEPTIGRFFVRLRELARQCIHVDPLLRLRPNVLFVEMATLLIDMGLIVSSDYILDVLRGEPVLIPSDLKVNDVLISQKLTMRDDPVSPLVWSGPFVHEKRHELSTAFMMTGDAGSSAGAAGGGGASAAGAP